MQRTGCARLIGALIVASTLLAAASAREKRPRSQPTAAELGARSARRLAAEARVSAPVPEALSCSTSYSRVNSAPFSWLDASIGKSVTFDDDETLIFDLPFDFLYYGQAFRWVSVCSNGWVSFVDDLSVSPDNGPIPDLLPSEPMAVIAPWWDDLDPTSGGEIFVHVFGATPNRVFVVEWLDLPRFDLDGSLFTFEVSLHESSNLIRFQYLSMAGTLDSATVGIESLDELSGSEFAYGNAPGMTGRAIEFRPSVAGLACGSATDVGCPGSRIGERTSPTSSYDEYGCNPGPLLAGEREFRLIVDQVADVEIEVSNTGTRTLWPFLFSSCSRCQCVDGGRPALRTVLGPGTYYIVVDGPAASDSGDFDLRVRSCDRLLADVPGTVMRVEPAGCDLLIDIDPFDTGNGVWTHRGWLNHVEEVRQGFALAIDRGGATEKIYTTNSTCTRFPRIGGWADANAEKAILVFEAPEARVLMRLLGTVSATGCCGVTVEANVLNLDAIPHDFELRAMYETMFSTGSAGGLCGSVGRPIDAGDVEVGASGSLQSEQSIAAFDPSTCFNPIRLFSADDRAPASPRVILQNSPASTPLAVAELVAYTSPQTPRPNPDVGSPCLVGWSGVYLDGEPTGSCRDDNGLVLSWNHPALAPDAVATSIHQFGDGCELNSCDPCQVRADLAAATTRICEGGGRKVQLEAGLSVVDGCSVGPTEVCTTSTTFFRWYWRAAGDPPPGTLLVGEECPELSIQSIAPFWPAGDYIFTVEVGCTGAPATCRAARNIAVRIDPEGTPARIGASLKGVRRDRSALFTWDDPMDVYSASFRLAHATAKNGFPSATPAVEGLAIPVAQHTDALIAPDPLYFYWAVGVSCTGIQGP